MLRRSHRNALMGICEAAGISLLINVCALTDGTFFNDPSPSEEPAALILSAASTKKDLFINVSPDQKTIIRCKIKVVSSFLGL